MILKNIYTFLIVFLIIISVTGCSSNQSVNIINNKNLMDNQKKNQEKLPLNNHRHQNKIISRNNSFYTSVISKGTASCGDLNLNDCKKQAYMLALENAAKQGTEIFIESFSEVDNSVLVKDNVKAKMMAKVLNHEILRQGMDGESGYSFTIDAFVERVISNVAQPAKEKNVRQLPNSIPQKERIENNTIKETPNKKRVNKFIYILPKEEYIPPNLNRWYDDNNKQ